MKHAGRFRRDARASVILEFALLMPVMTVLVLGAISATNMARASMKAYAVAEMMGDLVAQQGSVTAAQMSDFCTGLALTLPASAGSVQASVASVTNTATGTLTAAPVVDWQDTTCGGGSSISNALALGTVYTPNAQDSVIIVKVTYAYTFPPSYVLPASVTFTRITYTRPRLGAKVLHA